MFKNNLIKDQLYQNPKRSAKRGFAFVLKLMFALMILGGIGLIASDTVQPSESAKAPLADKLLNAHPVLASGFSNAPNPSQLNIPSLNISAPFEELGLNNNHTLAVPQNSMGVGWFVYGAKPGQIGAAVVVGHLDTAKGPAIFADLSKIKPGDKIVITRDDGSVVTYRVDSLAKYSQSNFPTQAIYAPVSYAAIRLITCSGTWDKKAGHYSQNLVVFGTEI
jgi:sortase (surface protein transpeptidase)